MSTPMPPHIFGGPIPDPRMLTVRISQKLMDQFRLLALDKNQSMNALATQLISAAVESHNGE